MLNKRKITTRALPETINIKGLTSVYCSAYLKYIFFKYKCHVDISLLIDALVILKREKTLFKS